MIMVITMIMILRGQHGNAYCTNDEDDEDDDDKGGFLR